MLRNPLDVHPVPRCQARETSPIVVCGPGKGAQGLCSDGASRWFGWGFLFIEESSGFPSGGGVCAPAQSLGPCLASSQPSAWVSVVVTMVFAFFFAVYSRVSTLP